MINVLKKTRLMYSKNQNEYIKNDFSENPREAERAKLQPTTGEKQQQEKSRSSFCKST